MDDCFGSTGRPVSVCDGAYQVSQSLSGTGRLNLCSSDDKQTYSNFAFEVKMTINQGDCGGLVIRDNSDDSTLLISGVPDGSYRFAKVCIE